jgi:hypothetical protein
VPNLCLDVLVAINQGSNTLVDAILYPLRVEKIVGRQWPYCKGIMISKQDENLASDINLKKHPLCRFNKDRPIEAIPHFLAAMAAGDVKAL